MKIGILSQIKQTKITGINRVTLGTMSELLKIDRENAYYYLGDTSWLPIELDTVDILFSIDKAIQLNYAVSAYGFNVVHSHSRAYELHKGLKCGKVLTVHDLIPFKHPEWNNQYDYFDGPLRRCAENADIVIAVSEYTKKDIVECFHVSPEKVKVVYSGLYPGNFFSSDNMGKCVEKLKGAQFLLCVSAMGINKNQAGLVEAFLLFKSRHKEEDVKLVLTGPTRQFQVIRNVMEKYKDVSDSVVFTGFVSDDELVWLYRASLAFAYVSFYEGFGLPILEALSVGKAVISSNTSSMPEVGGEAVEYCDPYDIESIAASIEKVVTDKTYREDLESRARLQASKFSYENTARQTLDIYKMFE